MHRHLLLPTKQRGFSPVQFHEYFKYSHMALRSTILSFDRAPISRPSYMYSPDAKVMRTPYMFRQSASGHNTPSHVDTSLLSYLQDELCGELVFREIRGRNLKRSQASAAMLSNSTVPMPSSFDNTEIGRLAHNNEQVALTKFIDINNYHQPKVNTAVTMTARLLEETDRQFIIEASTVDAYDADIKYSDAVAVFKTVPVAKLAARGVNAEQYRNLWDAKHVMLPNIVAQKVQLGNDAVREVSVFRESCFDAVSTPLFNGSATSTLADQGPTQYFRDVVLKHPTASTLSRPIAAYSRNNRSMVGSVFVGHNLAGPPNSIHGGMLITLLSEAATRLVTLDCQSFADGAFASSTSTVFDSSAHQVTPFVRHANTLFHQFTPFNAPLVISARIVDDGQYINRMPIRGSIVCVEVVASAPSTATQQGQQYCKCIFSVRV
ncbi:hypothetical protein GQ42DRAFT_162377 [Ramicandelaber brevisporus]|nr:hypothetical protein GQ42DRAFT_162377 [Ramicandelaber brevisporus]